ncbi:MAG: hypothetical protein B6D44_09040 [Ignavibacteriales bacterium UTCHB2]|jgi:hypothetical protein|nr:hypothetical protein [Candidatus Nomurabacteria bacterium]OQY72819.1 MAG: hypothetical protein B6D44_09040 [Ignavibacteriales bacterium UTCHB2]
MVTGDNRFAKLVSVGKLTPIKMTVKILVLKDGACLLNADTVYRMEDKTFEIITAGNLRFVIEDGIETVCFGIEWLNKKGLKYLTESFNIGGVEINILDTDSNETNSF